MYEMIDIFLTLTPEEIVSVVSLLLISLVLFGIAYIILSFLCHLGTLFFMKVFKTDKNGNLKK